MRPLNRRGRPPVAGLAERRREEILAAATSAFARHGFAGSDLQKVADALRVGKGTVYRYFASKEALFLAAVDRGLRRLQARVDAEAGPEREPLDRLSRAARAYLRFFDANPEVVELFVQERAAFRGRRPAYFAHQDLHLAPWTGLFRSLIREGRARRIPVGRITDVLGAAFYGVLFTNHFQGRRPNPERQARDVLDVVLHGILGANAAPGRRVRKTREPGERHP